MRLCLLASTCPSSTHGLFARGAIQLQEPMLTPLVAFQGFAHQEERNFKTDRGQSKAAHALCTAVEAMGRFSTIRCMRTCSSTDQDPCRVENGSHRC